jgi:hypothetical protein
MATRADLISRVMRNLGVWQAGQDLPPEDYRAIDEDLDRTLAAMGKANVYVIEDASSIPDEAFVEIAAYLANEYANVFGIAGEELQDIMRRAALADQALRYQRVAGPTFQPMAADYF